MRGALPALRRAFVQRVKQPFEDAERLDEVPLALACPCFHVRRNGASINTSVSRGKRRDYLVRSCLSQPGLHIRVCTSICFPIRQVVNANGAFRNKNIL